jgi:hypothetical protein
MSHLSSERLAELADAEPTLLEMEHLATCASCARERAAHRSLFMMARAEREQLGMPLTRWDSLAPELHRAGLVAADALMTSPQSASGEYTPAGRSASVRRAAMWLQAAAVVLLVGGGAVLGRVSAGVSPVPFVGHAERGPRLGSALPRPFDLLHVEPSEETYASVEEARAALRQYEEGFGRAAAYLAEYDSTTRVEDTEAYRARLAALDRTGRAMSEALREAPYDPVINSYYLITLGQREATLRQMSAALPEGRRIRSF